MDRDFLLKITNEFYRLTLLFPKKEPLRYKMRELTDDILALTLRITNQYESTNKSNNQHPRLINSVLENLEVLDGFFELAKSQNWVKKEDILNLQQDYSKLKEELKSKDKKTEDESLQVLLKETEVGSLSLASRQQMILALLKEKEKVQVGEVKRVFPQISKRTLRRDFRNLLKQGLIERLGERNDTFYQLKG